MLDVAAFCLVITAMLAYLNHRFVGLPTAIGVMVTALACSLGITSLPLRLEEELLLSINFSEVLMQGMLSLLLFAGALHVDLSELKAYRLQIGALALLGTVLSTLAVGQARRPTPATKLSSGHRIVPIKQRLSLFIRFG